MSSFLLQLQDFLSYSERLPPPKVKNKHIQTFRLSIPFREAFPPPGLKKQKKPPSNLRFLFAFFMYYQASGMALSGIKYKNS